MTSTGDSHLTDKQLLFYADGELSAKESARCRGHVDACWTCRARLDDLHWTIKEIVNFRNHVLLPMVPTPSRHWDGLNPRMHELDATHAKPSIADRLSGLFRSVLVAPRYAIFVVLLMGLLGIWVWLPLDSQISANELLARVQAAQSAELGRVAAPILHQRLRVRRRVAGSAEQATTDYDAWEDRSHGRFRQTGSSAEMLAELRTICDSNGLDWHAPLSAAGYLRWRDYLPARQDFVAPATAFPTRDAKSIPEALALTTVVAWQDGNSGNVNSQGRRDRIDKAEMVVRTADWHPVEERLWVSDREYEIAELDYRILPFSGVNASIFDEPAAPVKLIEVSRPLSESLQPPPPNPDETEMAVRFELHRLDADLGEPIEISRDSRGKVMVEASNVAPDLQAKLKHQLAAIPNAGVVVELTRGPACPACPAALRATQDKAMQTTAATLTIVPTVNLNEKRLEEIFGDPKAQESFTQEVLAVSGEALSHGFALRNLALRYTVEEEARLTPTAKAQLDAMVGDHLAALAEQTNRLQGLLRPLMEALSSSRTPGVNLTDTAEAPLVGAFEDAPAQAPRPDEAGSAVGLGPGQEPGSNAAASIFEWQNVGLEIFIGVKKADRLVKDLLTNTNTSLSAEEAVPELTQALSEQQKELNKYQRWMQ